MAQEAKQTLDKFFHSGGPGTTGREVFEDSTATGPAARYTSGGGVGAGAGAATGVGADSTTGSGATAGLTGDHHGHGHHHHEHGAAGADAGRASDATLGQAGTTGSTAYGSAGAGTGVGSGVGSTPSGQYGSVSNVGTHGHHSHDHDGHKAGVTGAAVGGGAAGAAASATGGATDRVGSLNQGGAVYERTGADGPATHGAAGTDRFDTDKVGAAAGSGVNDSAVTRAADAATGTGATSSGTAPTDSTFNKAVTTADKDFTGESRGTGLVSGAYTDNKGHFQNNTSGPGGNSALTGREGNVEKNPVAQAKQAAGQSIHDTHTGGVGATAASSTPTKTGTGTAASEAGSEKKKGIFQKIKDALE